MIRPILILTALGLVSACAAPGADQAPQCVAGTAGGAALGTIVGNEFGQGRGRDVMTVAGGVAGALAGQSVTCR